MPYRNRVTVEEEIEKKIAIAFYSSTLRYRWTLLPFPGRESAQPIARRPFVGVHKSVGSRSGGGQALYQYSAASLQPPLWQSKKKRMDVLVCTGRSLW